LKKNDLKNSLYDCDANDRNLPVQLTPEWLEKNARNARQIGYIKMGDLPWHLAKEEKYNSFIPGLWEEYECDRRGPKKPNIGTEIERGITWIQFFTRLAHGKLCGVKSTFNKEIEFPLYQYNMDSRKYEEYDREIAGGNIDYVKLTDLQNICSDILRIPLPSLLFPKHETVTYRIDSEKEAEVYLLARAVEPELECLWKTILKKAKFEGTSILNLSDNTNTLQKVIIAEFDSKLSDRAFEHVKKEHLKDTRLYSFYRPKNEKADFFGNLFSKIIEDQTEKVIGAQKAYQLFKTALKSKAYKK
jgi:hypothetical protein